MNQLLCWITLAGQVACLSAWADSPLPSPAPSPGATAELKPVSYETFQGEKVLLYPWLGKRVAILTKSPALNRQIMAELCAAFDGIFEFYAQATGREPTPLRIYEGRLTMAEVEKTCGAACGYLGHTGIELTPGVFQDLYSGYEKGRTIDQAPPYEFGRNFWFYGKQLAYQKPVTDRSVTTGYAVFMRMAALDAIRAKVGPFRDRTGAEFRAVMESLVDLYEADATLTWENTLKRDAAPKNPLGLNGTDLFASFCLRLMRDYGGLEFVKRLWKEVEKLPAAKSTEQALDNFVIAASRAAERDLSGHFATKWRWPVSPSAKKESAIPAPRRP